MTIRPDDEKNPLEIDPNPDAMPDTEDDDDSFEDSTRTRSISQSDTFGHTPPIIINDGQ